MFREGGTLKEVKILVDGASDGPTNMGADSALLEQAERGIPGGRVYSWSETWVTLGCFQKAERELVPGLEIPTIVRPTGGKGVLHGTDVTVGLAVPLELLNLEEAERNPNSVYACLGAPIAMALTACGLPSVLGRETQFAGRGVKTGDCFGYISPGDIVDPVSGIKRCGCALKVTRTAALLQGSIPNGRPPIDPARVFMRPGPVILQEWDATFFARELQDALRCVIGVKI